MRISRLVMLFVSAMLLANVPTRIACADGGANDVSHLTTGFEIVVGTLSSNPNSNKLEFLEEGGSKTFNVLTSNRDIEVEFETSISTDAVLFSLNLRISSAVSVSGFSFATQTAAVDRIMNWATNEFDEITDVEDIPANLYAEPGTGKVLLRVSRSYAEEAQVAFSDVTWVSSHLARLGAATAESLVLAPNGDDIFDIFGQSNVRIQTILPGVDLTSIPRSGRGILIAPDIVWRAEHNSDGIGSNYTFFDNAGNLHRAKALSFSQELGEDGVLVKIKWVDGTGATLPPPPGIQPALVPPADLPCLLRNPTNLAGYRVEYVGGHRLTAGSYSFNESAGSLLFNLNQSSDLHAGAWDEPAHGDSGGAMFLVVHGQVVAMAATWNDGAQGTAILAHLDALEAMSTDHEYVDLTEFRGFLLGDVNYDGLVSFLDITPFIAILSAGGFQAEADCNLDGAVNFLDISSFIALLN